MGNINFQPYLAVGNSIIMFNYFHCDLLNTGYYCICLLSSKPCLLKYSSWWYLTNTALWYYIECSKLKI